MHAVSFSWSEVCTENSGKKKIIIQKKKKKTGEDKSSLYVAEISKTCLMVVLIVWLVSLV